LVDLSPALKAQKQLKIINIKLNHQNEEKREVSIKVTQRGSTRAMWFQVQAPIEIGIRRSLPPHRS
jgi:hypothetical protein